MAEHSTIEWTDATWNPITGCSVISPGCTNCYAMDLAGTRLRNHPSRAGLTKPSKAGPVWTGEVRLNEGWLDQPLRWKRPRRIFVCAHGDLFHESVPDGWIDKVFAVMALAPQHTFQVLTKRAARMRKYMHAWPIGAARFHHVAAEAYQIDPSLPRSGISEAWVWKLRERWPLPNVWLGISAERQQEADQRIPDLLATPAAVHFLSCEPLLGQLDLDRWIERIDHCSCGAENEPQDKDICPTCGGGDGLISTWGEDEAERYRTGERYDPNSAAGRADIAGTNPMINWVIAGGESGPNARPSHPDWFRSLRDQCQAAGVPFFFKQWGEWLPTDNYPAMNPHSGWVRRRGHDSTLTREEELYPEGGAAHMERVGKARAGALLDGREHRAMPR